jgi:ATP-dependent RNA helicase RhlE
MSASAFASVANVAFAAVAKVLVSRAVATATNVTFASLALCQPLLDAVAETGYTHPTPVQAQAIPVVLARKDLLAGAQTGTGKTAAFALPILHNLALLAPPAVAASAAGKGKGPQGAQGAQGAARRGPIRVLVLTPTRELAAQIDESFRVYGKYLPYNSTVIFGGVGQGPQVEQIRRGVDILVATPGRLLDLSGQGLLDLSAVKILVLDEADRMLDMGFVHDVKKILKLVPAEKQSLLFSATFSNEIRELAGGLLHSPVSIQVTPPNTTVELIHQVVHPVSRDKKKELLLHVITTQNLRQVLTFTRTKHGANRVSDYLNKNGVSSMALHGNKSQTARTQALSSFKSGDLRVLVATDIAARGLDIDDLPNVVNFEIPNVSEDYVHRIGRTGRAGAKGEAISFVSVDEEGFMDNIEIFTKQRIPVVRIDEFAPVAGETAQPIAMGRQCLWGGRGKPPGRAVMEAAARAARKEIAENVRERKVQQGPGGQRPASSKGRSAV